VVEEDATVGAMHAASEKFNPRTERVFQWLQVLSACAVSFSHGELRCRVSLPGCLER
jgi:phosphate/sulfate permease